MPRLAPSSAIWRPAVYDFYMAKAGYTFETLTGIPGLGSMAKQDAGTVAITGGTITGVTVPEQVGNNVTGSSALQAAGGTARYFIVTDGNAPSILRGNVQIGNQPALSADVANGRVGIGTFAPIAAARLRIHHPRATDADSGCRRPIAMSAAIIRCSLPTWPGRASARLPRRRRRRPTTRSSDARLKHGRAEPGTANWTSMRALRPVRFVWKADDSARRRLSGRRGAGGDSRRGDDGRARSDGRVTGNIRPQQIDMSKLVPWLVGAVQTLAGQVELLTERVAELETGLGV